MRDLLVILAAAAAIGAGLLFAFPQWFGLVGDASEGAAGRGGRAGSGGPPPVLVAPTRRESFEDRLEALGTVRAMEAVQITTNRADLVEAVHFEDGEVVEAGALLVQLHDAEERAQLAEAIATRDERQADFERTRELEERQIRSAGDLDAAKAALAAAEARVARLEATIADHRIEAPFGGLLGFREVSTGAFVQPATVITTLDAVESVRLDIQIPEAWLAAVRVGQTVVARTEAFPGTGFRGEIRTIGSRLDPDTRSAAVRAILPNPDLRLRPGMLMKVAIERGEAPVLQVPEEALIQRGRQHFVMRVQGEVGSEGQAEQVEVEVGRRRPGFVEILSGLDEGDRVVVAGIVRVRTGGGPVRIAGLRGGDA